MCEDQDQILSTSSHYSTIRRRYSSSSLPENLITQKLVALKIITICYAHRVCGFSGARLCLLQELWGLCLEGLDGSKGDSPVEGWGLLNPRSLTRVLLLLRSASPSARNPHRALHEAAWAHPHHGCWVSKNLHFRLGQVAYLVGASSPVPGQGAELGCGWILEQCLSLSPLSLRSIHTALIKDYKYPC